jgi:nitrogen regulatory protein PII
VLTIDTLFFIITRRGEANNVLKKAQECGATGGTIFFGEDIVQSRLLEIFGQNLVHKEILMISSSDELCEKLHETLSKEFISGKRAKGKAFSIPFKHWQLEPTEQEQKNPPKQEKKDVRFSYFCIVTIVDKSRGKACIKAAKAAGARNGTLIHGRGAGIPANFCFPLVIEPQKDIVIIISTKDMVTQIKTKIFYDLELAKTGNGIIFTLPVSRISGFSENTPKPKKNKR